MNPVWKKSKTNQPDQSSHSFFLLPDEIILHCLARVSKSHYPKLSLVSKTLRSLLSSLDLNHTRFHYKTQESFFHVCLKLPHRPLPTWFTIWINPDQTLTNDLDKKKKMSTLVHAPSSSYANEPLFLVTVGSDIYAFKQCHPASRVMLVRNKESVVWRQAPNMTSPREYPVAHALDGKIYVMGGSTVNWGEVFDTMTQTWELLPNPPPEIYFSSMIRKIWITQGKIYTTTTSNYVDTVYDPKLSTWNVAAKALENRSNCMVDSLLYSCDSRNCMWYDAKGSEWRPVKGLSVLNRSARRGLIETVNYGGKLMILWDKTRRHCPYKSICCALVSLKMRKSGEVWGHVEWSNVVLTVPHGYRFLRSTSILT